jgi:hypothetical protein
MWVGEEDDALFGIFQDHGGPVGGKPDHSDFKIVPQGPLAHP